MLALLQVTFQAITYDFAKTGDPDHLTTND